MLAIAECHDNNLLGNTCFKMMDEKTFETSNGFS